MSIRSSAVACLKTSCFFSTLAETLLAAGALAGLQHRADMVKWRSERLSAVSVNMSPGGWMQHVPCRDHTRACDVTQGRDHTVTARSSRLPEYALTD